MATLILEHSDLSRSDRLGEILRDQGHRLQVHHLHRGDTVPDDLDGIDAIVSCGGPQSATDSSADWIEPEMNLLRDAHAQALPVVGLCLGSLLLARALGGEVGKLAGGANCGWKEMDLTPSGREDALYVGGHAWSSRQLFWHRSHVTKAPDGARIVAKSADVPCAAWAFGMRTYGIQYHPEVHETTIERWVRETPEVMNDAGETADDVLNATREFYPVARRLGDRLFERMALLLMPVDRRFAGISKDLHH